MTLDTAKLRERAKAATPGHWSVQGPWPHATIYAFDNPDLREDVEACHIASSPLILRSDQKCSDDADMAFIAAANPQVVIELLDDIDQLRRACATWQSIFTGFPHDAQQALRDLRERFAKAGDAARRFVAIVDDLSAFADDSDPRVMATAGPLGEAQAALWVALGLDVGREHARMLEDMENRCAICGWPLAETLEQGCVRGNCSMRPLPANYYAPERAAREHADMIRGVPVEQRGAKHHPECTCLDGGCDRRGKEQG